MTVTVSHIQIATAEFYKITLDELRGPKRTRAFSWPRQLSMTLTRKMTKMSLPEIGRRYGGRDHTTVIHATNAMADRIRARPDIKEEMSMIKSRARALAGVATFQARHSNPPVFKSRRTAGKG